jgi:hypothetical protein
MKKTLSDEFATIGVLLDNLTPRAIYHVALIDELMAKFGFAYDPATDALSYRGREVLLQSLSAGEVANEIAGDRPGGSLSEGLLPSERLVDADVLSAAVYRLLFPGQVPPSEASSRRTKRFRANVAAILEGERLRN